MSDKKIYKVFNMQTKSTDEEIREIEAVASYQAKDRDGDVIHLDGLDISNFKKNKGPILWSHNSNLPPIAKATDTWIDGKKLMMKLQFTSPEENSFGDTIYKLVKGGFINNLSIGFSPDWEKAEFNDKNKGYEFKKAELLETSIVNVPANSNARIITRSLNDAVKADVIDDIEAKEIELMLQELESDFIETKSEQTIENPHSDEDEIKEVDEIEILKQKVSELEDRLNKLSADTTDDLYSDLFEDDFGYVPKKVDPYEQLIKDVLDELGIEK